MIKIKKLFIVTFVDMDPYQIISTNIKEHYLLKQNYTFYFKLRQDYNFCNHNK